jgi:hypothetical protein
MMSRIETGRLVPPQSGSQVGCALTHGRGFGPPADGSCAHPAVRTWLPFSHPVTLNRRKLHPIGAKGRRGERLRPRGAGGSRGDTGPTADTTGAANMLRQPRSAGSIEGHATGERAP